MKILIFEDEKIAANRLVQLLQDLDPKIEVLAIVEGVKDGVNWLKNNPSPDLIFMDIQLGDGVCFEVFDQIAISCPVVFVTAFDKFAIQAFKVNSIDYILKPPTEESLKFALNKFHHLKGDTSSLQTSSNMNADQLNALITLLQPNYKSRFFIKINRTIHSIPTKDIFFFQSIDSSTFITNADGKRLLIDFTLDELEKVLDPQLFFRISRSYLVNIDAVEKISTYSKGRIQILLKHGPSTSLMVSRSRTKAFREWLGQGL